MAETDEDRVCVSVCKGWHDMCVVVLRVPGV